MGSDNPFREHPPSLTRKLLPWGLYALLPLALFRLFLYPLPLALSPTDHLLPSNKPIIIPTSPPPPPPPKEEEEIHVEIACDYADGDWVPDESGPLYNATTCGTIKDGQNCIGHGRPDTGFLHWRWKPRRCSLPRFEPNLFLNLMKDKHLAFVGDSMARNQMESLLCMLSAASSPELIFTNGEDNKFRRWIFRSHNLTVSIYWSPFLVKGIEKSKTGPDHNVLHLDSADEKWASELGHIDMIVLSVGHWFLHPAVFFDGDSVIGCHYCPNQNHTEIGFYGVFAKAIKTTLNSIITKKASRGDRMDAFVTTFSPSHFEGEWDKFGACSQTRPYRNGEKKMEAMDEEMRKIEVAEVKSAKINGEKLKNFKLEALDVSRLSFLRPDGHPGPYMYPFPFANGIQEQVQNDCVHWCLPGPVDTWNEIMLDLMKNWEGKYRGGK